MRLAPIPSSSTDSPEPSAGHSHPEAAPIPEGEAARLVDLRALGLLDTEPEERFDRFTRLAAETFRVPTARISLVDTNRQWFKPRRGMDATQTPRDVAFCARALFEERLLLIPDATRDPRIANNPLVTGSPGIRFYVGAVLRGPAGQPIGILCHIDRQPRELPEAQISLLLHLADIVQAEMHGRAQERARLHQALSQAWLDGSTSLPDMRFARDRLEAAVSARPRSESVRLVPIRLHGFVGLRRAIGWKDAATVMRDLAEHLTAALPERATVARWSGEEPTVVLPGAGPHQQIRAWLRRLRECASPGQPGSPLDEINIHLGASLYPDDALDAETMEDHAATAVAAIDPRCDRRVRLFDADLGLALDRQTLIARELRAALGSE